MADTEVSPIEGTCQLLPRFSIAEKNTFLFWKGEVIMLSTHGLTRITRPHKLAGPRPCGYHGLRKWEEHKDSPSDCRPHQSCSHPVSSHSPRLQKKKKGMARCSQSPKAWMLEPSSRGSFVGVQSTKIRRDGRKKLPFRSLCANSCLVWFLSISELSLSLVPPAEGNRQRQDRK